MLHPHVGTMVESGPEVQRVLEGSSIALCLDTGHLLIGGTDPADLARQVPDRIAHAHLKDVNSSIADRVRAGRLTLHRGGAGRHVPSARHRRRGRGGDRLGPGQNGYDGWYVLEQDTILTGEPPGEGPVTDVRASADYVRSVLRA